MDNITEKIETIHVSIKGKLVQIADLLKGLLCYRRLLGNDGIKGVFMPNQSEPVLICAVFAMDNI